MLDGDGAGWRAKFFGTSVPVKSTLRGWFEFEKKQTRSSLALIIHRSRVWINPSLWLGLEGFMFWLLDICRFYPMNKTQQVFSTKLETRSTHTKEWQLCKKFYLEIRDEGTVPSGCRFILKTRIQISFKIAVYLLKKKSMPK